MNSWREREGGRKAEIIGGGKVSTVHYNWAVTDRYRERMTN